MKCFICQKPTSKGYFCQEHAEMLYDMLKNRKGLIVEKPEFKDHCIICGEYKDRIIVDDSNGGLFCDKDIIEQYNLYKSDSDET